MLKQAQPYRQNNSEQLLSHTEAAKLLSCEKIQKWGEQSLSQYSIYILSMWSDDAHQNEK